MKNLYFLIILFLINLSISAQTGGRFKPSETRENEYLRALVVFAQFSGDQKKDKNWQKDNLPNWAFNFIDKKVSENYRKLTISDYWDDMSLGRFNFIGDVYPELVILPPEKNYIERKVHYEEANQDVLKIIDKKVDFRKYDNWKYSKQKKEFIFDEKKGDGLVDLIIIVYRNPETWFTGHYGAFTAISSFGKDYITNDDSIIVKGKLRETASGITVRQGLRGKVDLIERISHELGHYFFGYAHTNTGGIMGQDTYALNGWERIKLGYVEPIVVDNKGIKVKLRDFITTGDILKIPIPIDNPDSETYYLIENHQRISPYDQIARGGSQEGRHDFDSKMGSGIYIWLVRKGKMFPPIMDLKTADGKWDWELADTVRMPKGWPEVMPLAKRVAVNREKGESDRSKRVVEYPTKNKWWELWHDTNVFGEYVLTRDKMGDETDAFNIGYNEIFSPWSNPSSVYKDNDNITVHLIRDENDYIELEVLTNRDSAIDLPPSKPQFLRVKKDFGAINLKWELNIEPDISEYEIWRKIDNDDYKKIASVNSGKDQFFDAGIKNSSGIKTVIYKIRAKDRDGKTSLFGEEAGIKL